MNLAKTLKSIVTEASTLNDYLSSRGINPKFVSRDTKISHAKSALFQKWKSDRKMAEETIVEASETELLAKYLNSRGINPKFATKDQKIAHSKSGEFMKWKRDHQHFELSEETDKKDMVCFDIPLLIRVLEYTREDMKTDIELHNMVERLINMRETYPLTMKEYDTITSNLVKENHIAIAMGKMLDDESGMVLTQIEELERGCAMIRSYIGKDYEKQLPAWVQAKITLATDYMSTVGNYLVSKNEKVNEEVLDEAKKPRTTALEKWRKAAAEREKKHNTVPMGDMKGAIDKLEKHLNKEEVEQIDEITQADVDKSAEQEVAHAKKHGWKVQQQTYGRTYTHPKHGHIDMNRYGEWEHRPKTGISRGKGDLISHGEFKDLDKHISSLKEEVEQIDELKKSTVFSWLKQQPVVPEKKPGMDKKAHNQRIKTHSKSWNRALDRLSGYKPTSENTLDSLAATEAPCDNSDMTNGTSKAAKMVKDLKKKIKEETYDWEKDDKSSMQKPYGKAPKINVTDKKGTLGDTKPEARAVMKGGTTLTGQPRDMVEIDPSMKQRPGQQDKGQNVFTSPTGKKSPSL